MKSTITREIILFGLILIALPAFAAEGQIDMTAGWAYIKTTIVDPLMVYMTPAIIISWVTGLLMAVLPQGKPGTPWDSVRSFLNIIGLNFGSAKNQVLK